MHRHRIEPLPGVGMPAERQAGAIGRQRVFGRRHPGHALLDRHAREQHSQIGQRTGIGQATGRQFVGHRQHALGVAGGQGVQQAHQVALVDGA
ncbi:hypothetical protein G6F66_015325 [Rhizopus arrhizus]|nr:hypothetical protein G6F66_015325 [Rhizopus arrhizus]